MPRVTVLNIPVSCGTRPCARIVMDCERQETTSRSNGKLLRMNLSMNDVPSRIFTARCGASLNQVPVLRFSRQKRDSTL